MIVANKMDKIFTMLAVFLCRRRHYGSRSRSNRRWFIYLCLLILILILIILSTNQQSIRIFLSRQYYRWLYESSQRHLHALAARYGQFLNRSNTNFITSSIPFQPSIPSYYPQLPILLFTQNLTSLKKVTKLILLANGFFEHDKWGLDAIDQSSAAIMTQLSCPFLADYCDVTTDNYLLPKADAVVFHIRNDIDRERANKYRRPDQRFVFTLWESPTYTPDLKSFNHFFNWTMTYRYQSDIIASYYFAQAYVHKSSHYYQLMLEEKKRKNLQFETYTVGYQLSDEILAEKKLGTAAALISNCGGGSKRLRFLMFLRRYMDLKIYGKCGTECPAGVDCREFIARNYYFFFSFENSLCQDYTTEKFFVTLRYPIVPVVYGRANYSYLLPSSAFIDVNDFDGIPSLARYLNETRRNKEKYLSYFTWKKDYAWGLAQFFTPFCDLCLRLHLDSTPKIIDDIESWWKQETCYFARNFRVK